MRETRYWTYEKDGVERRIRIAVSPAQTTMNPDPDHTHQFLLENGWRCVSVDPIPGLVLEDNHLYPTQFGYWY